MRFDMNQTQVLFEIDGQVIDKCNLHRLLNVSENCIFKVMEDDEVELFFKVCIKYGEKIARYPELLEGFANEAYAIWRRSKNGMCSMEWYAY